MILRLRLLALFFCSLSVVTQTPEPPLRVAIAGLVQGHVDGFFRGIHNRHDIAVVGISDPDPALHQKYAAKYGLATNIFFAELNKMLDGVKPDAVATFTSTAGHLAVV